MHRTDTHRTEPVPPPNGLFAVRHVRANIHHFAREILWEILGQDAFAVETSDPRVLVRFHDLENSLLAPGMTPRAMDTARDGIRAALAHLRAVGAIHLVWVPDPDADSSGYHDTPGAYHYTALFACDPELRRLVNAREEVSCDV